MWDLWAERMKRRRNLGLRERMGKNEREEGRGGKREMSGNESQAVTCQT